MKMPPVGAELSGAGEERTDRHNKADFAKAHLKMDLGEIGWELRNGIIWLRMTSGLQL